MKQTMHHTVTTSHMFMEQDLKGRTIVKEKGKKIVDKISINKIPINRSSDNKKDGQDSVFRTRYGRVLKKLDGLAY